LLLNRALLGRGSLPFMMSPTIHYMAVAWRRLVLFFTVLPPAPLTIGKPESNQWDPQGSV